MLHAVAHYHWVQHEGPAAHFFNDTNLNDVDVAAEGEVEGPIEAPTHTVLNVEDASMITNLPKKYPRGRGQH